MRRIISARQALASLLLVMTSAACGGGDKGTGPNDDGVFGTYTLARAAGQQVPQAKVFEANLGFGGLMGTYAQSGSFRISENGTWAFSLHFQQIATAPGEPVSTIEYDVDDSGTYSMQNGTITLDGSTVVTLVSGVLTYTVNYNSVPNVPPTTVAYEFEK